MKTKTTCSLTALALCLAGAAHAQQISLESAPPVVVRTIPVAGATDVDPAVTELRVTFSKAMQDGSWSWSTWGEENFPETTGSPKYLADNRTCVLPVKLQPDKFYAIWLNSEKFKNFKDTSGRSAVPYLLTFFTGGKSLSGTTATTNGFEYVIRSGDTLSAIVNAFRQRGITATVEDVLNANPGLGPNKLTVGQKIFVPASSPAPAPQAATTPERKFVRVVLDAKQMTFEDQPTSWDKLGSLLSAVPDRERTVLEWGIPSAQITVQQENDWSGRFAELARKYGFEYSSYVGVQAFGSRGSTPPVVRPGFSSVVPESELPLPNQAFNRG